MIVKTVALAAGIALSQSAIAGPCRPVEYPELTEMRTSPLRNVVGKHLNNHHAYITYPSAGGRENAEQCESEIEALVETSKNRKDLTMIRKTHAMGMALGILYQARYKSIVGPL